MYRHEQLPDTHPEVGVIRIKMMKLKGTETRVPRLLCQFAGKAKGQRCGWQRPLPKGADASSLDMNDEWIKALFAPTDAFKKNIETQKESNKTE